MNLLNLKGIQFDIERTFKTHHPALGGKWGPLSAEERIAHDLHSDPLKRAYFELTNTVVHVQSMISVVRYVVSSRSASFASSVIGHPPPEYWDRLQAHRMHAMRVDATIFNIGGSLYEHEMYHDLTEHLGHFMGKDFDTDAASWEGVADEPIPEV